MQDHASHWTRLIAMDEPSREWPRLRRRLRAALMRQGWSSQTFTALVLGVATLWATGAFVWMLPTMGRGGAAGASAAVSPQSITSPAAAAAAVKPQADPSAQVYGLPHMMTQLAGATGESIGRLEGHLEASMRPVAYASAGAVQPRGERVVYLVDASGSLLDSFPHVVEWLGDSLDALDRQQRFTVLFFRQGQVIEVPPPGLKASRFTSKAKVWNWMQPETGNVLPQGRSGLGEALEAAMAYRPSDVVLLSDDSLSRRGEGDSIVADVSGALAGRSVVIHAVQFFYRDEAGALEALADRFGGYYDYIEAADDGGSTVAVDPLLESLLD